MLLEELTFEVAQCIQEQIVLGVGQCIQEQIVLEVGQCIQVPIASVAVHCAPEQIVLEEVVPLQHLVQQDSSKQEASWKH
jgi:hypothetical protein